MLTGAVIAVGVQHPLLVLPFAFLSHFFLDIFPHFGVMEKDTPARNSHPLFKFVLFIDTILAIALLFIVPFAVVQGVNWWVIFFGMLIAWIPDSVWLAHYWHDHKGRMRTEPVWLTRFHLKIQWFEKPPGIVLELIWFGCMTTILGALIA